MATARAIFQAHIDGLLPESLPFDCQWASSDSAGNITTFNIQAGDNTITPPPRTTFIVFVLPPTASSTLRLKGNVADLGCLLNPTLPFVLTWTGVGGIIITATNPVPDCIIAYF